MTMHREINPQLFGNQTAVEKIGQPVDLSKPAAGIMGRPAPENRPQVPYGPNEIKAMEQQVSSLRLALAQSEKRSEALALKLDEVARMVHVRLERFSQAIVRTEEVQSQSQQEMTAKLALILAKVNERKVTDTKVQELIDRHNTIIRNFENRLTSLQRLVSEQEMALHNAQAALEETRAELAKARR
jgi:chromosome segregation ATPase